MCMSLTVQFIQEGQGLLLQKQKSLSLVELLHLLSNRRRASCKVEFNGPNFVSLSSSRKSRKFPSKEMERSSICLRTKLSREGNNSIQSFITRADKSCNSFGISRTISQFLPFESLRNYWVRILNTNLFSVVVMFPVWEIDQSSILYRTLIN